VAALRAAGLSDVEVLDAAQITGSFNFVNRLVLGLGVAVEAEAERQGYKYD
jgi:alkylhydroperoxidase family enzyme